jgi:hypothetical protein
LRKSPQHKIKKHSEREREIQKSNVQIIEAPLRKEKERKYRIEKIFMKIIQNNSQMDRRVQTERKPTPHPTQWTKTDKCQGT